MRRPAQFFRPFLRLCGFCVLGASMSGFAPINGQLTTLANHRLQLTDAPVRYMYPEVRLRKLHLVRPDLILYPIEYEIYC
jgi:hypothetical protein